MLTAQNDQYQDQLESHQDPLFSSITNQQEQQQQQQQSTVLFDITALIHDDDSPRSTQNTKFHGEIYFGLFIGVKVLNHGFGDRISSFSSKYLLI